MLQYLAILLGNPLPTSLIRKLLISPSTLLLVMFLYPIVGSINFTMQRVIVLHSFNICVCSIVFLRHRILRLYSTGTSKERENNEKATEYLVSAFGKFIYCYVLCFVGFAHFIVLLITFVALYNTFTTELVRELLGGVIFGSITRILGGSDDTTAGASSAGTPTSKKASSKKEGGKSSSRYVVTDEGPHFKRMARGCLLPADLGPNYAL